MRHPNAELPGVKSLGSSAFGRTNHGRGRSPILCRLFYVTSSRQTPLQSGILNLPPGEGYRRVMDCLKPGGALALFWNHPYPNRENDAGNLVNRRIYAKYRPSGGEPVEFSERDCGGTPYGV